MMEILQFQSFFNSAKERLNRAAWSCRARSRKTGEVSRQGYSSVIFIFFAGEMMIFSMWDLHL